MPKDDRSYVDDLRSQYVRDAAAQAATRFDNWIHGTRRNGSGCESPIEKRFLGEALVRNWDSPDQYEWSRALDVFRKVAGREVLGCLILETEPGFLAVQLPMLERECRIDVALVVRRHERGPDFVESFQPIAVELDGHDFHERTRAQSERDKSRDRALQRAGWLALRFTGSEVHRNVKGCWDELDELVYGIYLGDEPEGSP